MRARYNQTIKELFEKEINTSNIDMERVNEELDFFTKMGWDKYVIFLYNFMKQFESNDFRFQKSSLDSYVLAKLLGYRVPEKGSISDIRNKEVLYNDALRLDVGARKTSPKLKRNIVSLNDVLEKEIKDSELFYKEKLIGSECYLLVISEKELTEEEMNIIINEKKETTDEILRKVLIIKVEISSWV